MKNVILFPGTDAVENPILRAQALALPGVEEKIKETEKIIDSICYEKIDLLSYMTSPNDLSIEGFRKLVFCSLATQVALFENYIAENGKPDCIMGLSLGDVPRSVVSGLVSYEDGVRNLHVFTQLYRLAEDGICVHVKLDETFDASESILKLDEYGISKSVIQNEKFGLLAGPSYCMSRWIAEIAKPLALNIRPMYPFPLHTSLMKPVADALMPHVKESCEIGKMHTEIFSTVYGKVLTTKEDIINDCTYNISAALDFPYAINEIVKLYGDVNFVSIGPSNSLLKFLNCMQLPETVYQNDWYLESIAKAA